MKPQSDVAFAGFAGIDWSDTKHDICLQAGDREEREFAVVPHRPAAIDAWASALRQRFKAVRWRCAWSHRHRLDARKEQD